MLKSTARLSSDSQKKVEERRQQLKRSIEEKGGVWDERWVVDGVPRAAGVNSGRLDMYYISPDGKRMRSMSEVYQYLGLTTPAPKSTRLMPVQAAPDAPRSSREAKIYATAAISASVTNPYPVQHSPGGLSAKRPRPSAIAIGPSAARPYLDMEVRLALEKPERWKQVMFPVDARSRAAADAYEVSLRQSCIAEWRRSHNADARTLAEHVSSHLEEAQKGMQAHAVQISQHFQFLEESVFPLMSELLTACDKAGVLPAEAKQAAEKMQSRHKDFAEATQRQSVEAATAQTRLTEELSRISTDMEESAPKAARSATPRPPNAEAHAAASAAAAAAAALVPAEVQQTSVRAAGASAAAAAAAASIPQRAGRRPTPAIGSAAARVNEAAARAHAGGSNAQAVPAAPSAAGGMRAQHAQQHTTLATANGVLPPMLNDSHVRPAATAAPAAAAVGAAASGTPPQAAQSNSARSPPTHSGATKLNNGTLHGHATFELAPEVTVQTGRGNVFGRLGNPSIHAREDGTLWSVEGKQVPVSEACHYLFSAKGSAGKFAGKNLPAVKPGHLTEEQHNEALMTAGRRLIWSACVAEKRARQQQHRAASQSADAVMLANQSKPVGPVPMQQ
eukprot:jgi/Ulvmu1/8457/UM043_0037.1